MGRVSRTRLRDILHRHGVKSVAQDVADRLGMNPVSVARQLYYSLKGERNLPTAYQEALETYVRTSESSQKVTELTKAIGSIRATARRIATDLGLKESSVRRQLQRVVRGERDIPSAYLSVMEKVRKDADQLTRGRLRLTTLLDSGRYSIHDLARKLGVSTRRLRAAMDGVSDIPDSAISKIDRRFRYIAKERPKLKRPRERKEPPKDLFELPSFAPNWAVDARTGDPGQLYRFYAHFYVVILTEGEEYQKIRRDGFITSMLGAGLPGSISQQELLDLATEAAVQIEASMVKQGISAMVTPLCIMRHPRPQPRWKGGNR